MPKEGEDAYRVEKDWMGEMQVPAKAYYAAQTARALENFPISGLGLQRPFIKALGLIKAAAAKANAELGLLDRNKAGAIEKAAMEIAEGKFDEEFVVDVFQTGSGTSTNVNANEVIGNRAIELLGGKRGDKSLIHPNDHVNMCQSTNDVFPTAIHVGALVETEVKLIPSLELLRKSLSDKEKEFENVVKAGRTHLQDAVPITLGQEFSAYASMIDHTIQRIRNALHHLEELPIGGTAAGTGLNAHPKFSALVIEELNRVTGKKFRKADNTFEAMMSKDAAVELSGAFKLLAEDLLKICNDLRLLSSGPLTGLGEIELPATQPGSSIMPGKVNPVIPESVNMVACQVIGNDLTIAAANRLGELELNMGMPVIAYNLLQSTEILANAARNLAERCIKGIVADLEACRSYAESTPMVLTAITPIIGYDNATKVAKKVLDTGKSVRSVLLEEGILTQEEIDRILDLKKMTEGGTASRK